MSRRDPGGAPAPDEAAHLAPLSRALQRGTDLASRKEQVILQAEEVEGYAWRPLTDAPTTKLTTL